MNKPLQVLVTFLFIALSPGLLLHADTPSVAMMPSVTGTKVPPHFTYLTGDERAWADFPKAPELGSTVDENDLAITLVAQATRTDAQKQEAFIDQHYSIKLLTSVISPDFETKYPATYAVLKNAGMDAGMITEKLKKENHRLRPFAQHPTLVVPLFTVEDFSYPSGHASGSAVQARILSELFPERAEDLFKRARQVADGRVVAGAHYASDTEFGEKLGDLIFEQLEASAKFKRDLADAAQKDGIPLK
jgi:hypothetical protein